VKDLLPIFAKATALGIEIASCVIVGVLLGLWADKSFNTRPLFLIIGVILGAIAGYLPVISLVKKIK